MALSLPHFTFQIVRTFRLSLQIKPKISAFIVLHRRVQCIFQRAPYTVAVVWIYINYMHFEVTNTKKNRAIYKTVLVWNDMKILRNRRKRSNHQRNCVCTWTNATNVLFVWSIWTELHKIAVQCNTKKSSNWKKERNNNEWMNGIIYILILHI